MELNFQNTQIKILLWRQDYSDFPGLDKIMNYDIDNIQEIFDGTLSWKRLLNKGGYAEYKETLKDRLDDYRDELWDALVAKEDQPRLLTNLLDISEDIISIGNISSTLGFENSFGFAVKLGNLSEQIESIRENDIIAVLEKRKGEAEFKTEYIGFVTSIVESRSPGQISKFEIGTFGLNKFLALSRVIGLRGVWSQFDGLGEITDPELTMFQTRWQNKTVKEIMQLILEEVYNLSTPYETNEIEEIEGNPEFIYKYKYGKDYTTAGGSSLVHNTQKKINENTELINEKEKELTKVNNLSPEGQKLTREINSLKLENKKLKKDLNELNSAVSKKKWLKLGYLFLHLYYMVREDLADKDKMEGQLRVDYEPLENTICTIEKADINPYNRLIAGGLPDFYSQLALPADVLNQAKSITFYEIFENRDSQLICRPPLYNRFSIATEQQAGQINLKENVAENNKYIIEKPLDFTSTRNDSILETRKDYKMVLPFKGELGIVAGHFTDFLLTAKYGSRVDGPKSNPISLTLELSALLSAIDLIRSNAATRQATVEADNDRKYEIGRIYYFPEHSVVGYLVDISETFNLGTGIVSNTLKLIYIRKVYPKKDSLGNVVPNEFEFKILPSINDAQFLYSQVVNSAKDKANDRIADSEQPKEVIPSGAAKVSDGYYISRTMKKKARRRTFRDVKNWDNTWTEEMDEGLTEYQKTKFKQGIFIRGGQLPEKFMDQNFINDLFDADNDLNEFFKNNKMKYYNKPKLDKTVFTIDDLYRIEGDPVEVQTQNDELVEMNFGEIDSFTITNISNTIKVDDKDGQVKDVEYLFNKIEDRLFRNHGIVYIDQALIDYNSFTLTLVEAFNLVLLETIGTTNIFIQETKVPTISNIINSKGIIYGFKTDEDSTEGYTDGVFEEGVNDPHTSGNAIDIVLDYAAPLNLEGKAEFRRLSENNGLGFLKNPDQVMNISKEYEMFGNPVTQFFYYHIERKGFAKGAT